jgi:hypothetical protein
VVRAEERERENKWVHQNREEEEDGCGQRRVGK